MKPVEGLMLSGKGVCPSMWWETNRNVSQNYYTLKYVHPSCNENVQPQIDNAKQDHVSWHHADKTKLTEWMTTVMTNAWNTKSKQINAQHDNCQSENIVTNKSTICQVLLSWKMLNLKSERCMKAQPKWSRTDPHLLLIEREVRSCVLVRGLG